MLGAKPARQTLISEPHLQSKSILKLDHQPLVRPSRGGSGYKDEKRLQLPVHSEPSFAIKTATFFKDALIHIVRQIEKHASP